MSRFTKGNAGRPKGSKKKEALGTKEELARWAAAVLERNAPLIESILQDPASGASRVSLIRFLADRAHGPLEGSLKVSVSGASSWIREGLTEAQAYARLNAYVELEVNRQLRAAGLPLRFWHGQLEIEAKDEWGHTKGVPAGRLEGGHLLKAAITSEVVEERKLLTETGDARGNTVLAVEIVTEDPK